MGLPGLQGTSGSSGSSGSSGTSGTRGSSGSSGTSGQNGTSGSSGSSGTSGATGTSGSSGSSGRDGVMGLPGIQGTSGATGSSGSSGSSGTSGATGSGGSSGSSGSSGTSGAGTISGGVANRIAIFSDATTLTSNAGLTYVGSVLSVTGDVNATTGYLVNSAATTGQYLRGNGTRFVSSTIQVGDVPTLNQNTTGQAGSVDWANITGQRTLLRDNAGLQGNAGARSGFFETSTPTNYYSGASSWQHLIEARHTNDTNNFAMQIAGSFFDQEFYVRKTNNSATTGWSKLLTTNATVTVAQGGTGTTTFTAGYVLFGNGTSAINTSANLFWDNGNARLGIGTTSPATKLDVNGTIALGGFSFAVKSGNYHQIYEPAGNTAIFLGNATDPGNYYDNTSHIFRSRAGGATYTTLNSTGLGIGVSPSYKLHVSGDIYATANITAYSDRRAKKDIITIDNALAKVNSLRGVYYNRIDDEKNLRNVGVIAQEVLEVVPELVSYAEDIDQYSVKYGNITAVLIEAIKELNKKIEQLEQKQ
jgi:hypothetical protein